MKLTAQEIASVLKLPAPKRYDYFIKKVADRRKAWGLYEQGWALVANADGSSAFPLWPAVEYADACRQGDWSNYQPREVDVDDLLGGLLPSLRERSTALCVFYTPGDHGILVDIDRFEADLRSELSKIE
jgi:hypothetical protein